MTVWVILKVQRLSREGVQLSSWKCLAPLLGDDIVSSAWEHAAVHKRTGQEVTSLPEGNVYGGTSGTTAEKRYYTAFKEKYKGIAKVQDEWVNTALLTKEQVISTGLKFYWPKIKLTPSGYIQGNTNVRNYPVQNLATAEIIPIGVTYVWHHMKEQKLESFLINTVHDSIISEETPEETEVINEITIYAFDTEVINYLDKVYGINFNIPLDIDVDTYTHWSSD